LENLEETLVLKYIITCGKDHLLHHLKELKNAETQYYSGILSNGLRDPSTFSFDCKTASLLFHQSCGCQCVCCKVPKMYGVSMR